MGIDYRDEFRREWEAESRETQNAGNWSAGFEYDEGRLGQAAIYGLRSRKEAIAWLKKAFDWSLCWYKLPSCWIKRKQP